MRTWLDQHTEAVGQEVRRRWVTDPRTRGHAVPSDYELMRDITSSGMASALGVARHPTMDEFESGFLAVLSPFFVAPDERRNEPYACVVGRNLARLFGDAVAAPEAKRHAEAFARQKCVAYIDVADRAFRLGAEHHLKAVVLARLPADAHHVGPAAPKSIGVQAFDGLLLYAVIGQIGRLADSRMAWAAGSQEIYCDHALNVTVQKLLDRSGKTLADVARDIENLVWLTLAYASVAEPMARQPLPMVAGDLSDRVDRGARRQRRQFSLFRVERLQPPAGNFGRDGGGNAEGWQLERRIAVRGHFKMQPHGPHGALRKLIFVGQHCRGPLDAPPLHKIVALDT
jgi:hypothetical protein